MADFDPDDPKYDEMAVGPDRETPEQIQSRAQWRKKAAAERIEDLKKEQEQLQKILKTETDTYALKELQKSLSETNNELLSTYREHMRDLARVGDEISDDLKDQVRELEKVVKEEQKRAKAVEESAEAAKNLGKSLGQAFRITRGGIIDVTNLGDKFHDMGKAIGNAKGGIKGFALEFGKAFGSAYLQMLVDMATMLVKLAMEVENVGRNMRRTTGMSQELARAIESAIPEVRAFTHEFEGLADAGAVLYRNFTDFSLINSEVASQLALEATLLNRLGVSYESYADSVQISTKALGVSAEASADLVRDLTAFAMNIGTDVGQLTSGFATSTEHVAKFGADGVKAFKDLARTSKITGIDLGRLFAIVSKFDTFEGAAEQAGMLNAALGGNFVNAMDLMMETDPATRFDMIRDAVMGAAGSFEEMGYYQRIFYARAAGLDNVAELALMMSGRYDLLGDKMQGNTSDYVAMAEKARSFQTVQDEIATLIQRNIKQLPEVMKAVDKVIKFLASPEGQKTVSDFFNNAVKLVQILANNIDRIIGMLPALEKGTSFFGPIAAVVGTIGAFAYGTSQGILSNIITDKFGKGKKPPGGPGGGGGAPGPRPTVSTTRATGLVDDVGRAVTAPRATVDIPGLPAPGSTGATRPGFFRRMATAVGDGTSTALGKARDAASKMGGTRGGRGGGMFPRGRGGFVNLDMLTLGQGERLGRAGTKIGEFLTRQGNRFLNFSRDIGPLGEFIGNKLTAIKAPITGFVDSVPTLARAADALSGPFRVVTSGLRSIGKFLGPVGLVLDAIFGLKGAFDFWNASVERGESLLYNIQNAVTGFVDGLAGGFKFLFSFIPGFDKTGSLFKLEGFDMDALETGEKGTRLREQQVKIQTELLRRSQREGKSVQALLSEASTKIEEGGKATARTIRNPEAIQSVETVKAAQAAMGEAAVRPTTRLAETLNEWTNAMKPSTILENTLPDQEITVNLTLDGKVIDQRTIKTIGNAAGLSGITGYGFGNQG